MAGRVGNHLYFPASCSYSFNSQSAMYDASMWLSWLGWLWRSAPGRVRRWGVWLAEPRFMVTAGAVVLDERGRVLLLEHRFRAGTGWGIPGGFLEKGEQPDEALRRELREEVGLEVAGLELVFARTLRRPQQVELHYLCRARDSGAARPHSGEIISVEWFAPEALPPQLPPAQRGLIERALQSGAQAKE